jgi:hypothetical protein
VLLRDLNDPRGIEGIVTDETLQKVFCPLSGQGLVRFGCYDDVVRSDDSDYAQEVATFSTATLTRERASANRQSSAPARKSGDKSESTELIKN